MTTPYFICQKSKTWYIHLVSSLVLFFGGILFIILFRVVCSFINFLRKRNEGKNPPESNFLENNFKGRSRERNDDMDSRDRNIFQATNTNRLVSKFGKINLFCEKIISGQTKSGKILLSLSCLVNLVSLLLYLIETTKVPPMERKFRLMFAPFRIVDVACQCFFFVYFILKLLASKDRLWFLLQLPTIADFFTIPPCVVTLILRTEWIGLSFFCVFRFLNFPEVLQFLRILKTSIQIRLSELLFIFFVVWLSSAGFIHLVENSGDPNDCESIRISYWDSMYLVIITMSSVGYGDISCQTIIGKIFIVLFIIGAVALFASFIPEIMEILRSTRQIYETEYKKEIGIRHLIVGGEVTYDTVNNFVRDFTHDDRISNDYKSVFVSSEDPDLELNSLFKRHFTKILFIKGSLLNMKALRKIRLQECECLVILTDQNSEDPHEVDMRNIMKAISVKNFCPEVRVIMQLIKLENKKASMNLPFWGEQDHILCLTELKMGFMALGCMAPGFATFLTNLLYLISFKKNSRYLDWQKDYLKGAEIEVYTSFFSSFFFERTFDEVVKFCYSRFNLMLIGASHTSDKTGNDQPKIILNPTSQYRISKKTTGFFLCASEENTRSVRHYCLKCHHNSPTNLIKACVCVASDLHGILLKAEQTGIFNRKVTRKGGVSEYEEQPQTKLEFRESFIKDINHSLGFLNTDKNNEYCIKNSYYDNNNSRRPSFVEGDSEVLPHISLTRTSSISDEVIFQPNFFNEEEANVKAGSVLNQTIKYRRSLSTYSEGFDVTGSYHCSNSTNIEESLLNDELLRRIQLEGHIIVWTTCFSPGALKAFLLPLRSSSISNIRSVVFLSDDLEKIKEEWPSIQNFPKVYIKKGSVLDRSVLRELSVDKSHMLLVMSSFNEDTMAILVTLNIKRKKDLNQKTKFILNNLPHIKSINDSHIQVSESQVSILTEIVNKKSVEFVDLDDVDDPDIPFFCSQPYACGRVFVSNFFDTLTTTIFFSPESYKLVKMFITGTDTDVQDFLEAEGLIQNQGPYYLTKDVLANLEHRCNVELLSLNSTILKEFEPGGYYFSDVFLKTYSKYGILCIGLYRLLSIYDDQITNKYRFVFSNPPHDTLLHASDLVYCLCPSRFCDISTIKVENETVI